MLTVKNSSFSSCFSIDDGSIIKSYDAAVVYVTNSTFLNLRSDGFGGAISAVGSRVYLSTTNFINCTSASGGGAVWVSTYVCYGTSLSDNTTIVIDSCVFHRCSSRNEGGALSATSESTDVSSSGQSIRITVVSTVFSHCSAEQGGGLSFSGISVESTFHSCKFLGLLSSGFGGAISVIGSKVILESSQFANCSSEGGGGCVSISGSQSQGRYAPRNTTLSIVSSSFKLCNSQNLGGAILASSNALSTNHFVLLQIASSNFSSCTSLTNGGAVSALGSAVVAVALDSSFDLCYASNSGGAIAADNQATLVIRRLLCNGNEAAGLGGGAIYVRTSFLHLEHCVCVGNAASSGGGGALLWDGDILSPYDFTSSDNLLCVEQTNVAKYGPCFASKYSFLQVNGLPQGDSPAYAGSNIRLQVIKKDIYNQTIVTDSMSILQTLDFISRTFVSAVSPAISGKSIVNLQEGVAIFDINVNPVFSKSDYIDGIAFLEQNTSIYFRGIDSEQVLQANMQSVPAVLAMASNVSVCPKGYILVLDSFGRGSCSECSAGTYSIYPLAGIPSGKASCLTCPPLTTCSAGANITFSLGSWQVINGIYRLVGCPPMHQLVNSINGVFNHDIQQCVACQTDQYILDSNNSAFSCQSWTYNAYVEVVVSLPLSLTDFSASKQLDFAYALASITSVRVQKVMVNVISSTRRYQSSSIQVDSKIAAENASEATAISGKIDSAALNSKLVAAGLPVATQLSTSIVIEDSPAAVPVALAVGVSVTGFVVLVVACGSGIFLCGEIRRQLASKAFLQCMQRAAKGERFDHLPLELKNTYVPDWVIGKGAFAVVVRAKVRKSGKLVAIKFIMPGKSRFEENEVRQLKREESILNLVTSLKTENAVHTIGIDATTLKPSLCWFILELLDGEDLGITVQRGPFGDLECIKLARSILAVLKVIHSEGVIHRDVKPANIMACNDDTTSSIKTSQCSFKLIDFGSAVGVDENLAKEPMMTISSNNLMGVGTPAYMSPEMFLDWPKAKYPTDLWSLGVTMFELVTGVLPFQTASDHPGLWANVIADMKTKAPSVLDKLSEDRRSLFDNYLAKVIEKALEKEIDSRYSSADNMYEAVYGCLIRKGEAVYSAFISYRVASELPLAQILFDELNHTVTPGGHRVTVYWDAHRLVKGEDWEEGFATGLLNSLCFFPLMSYGSTAPLAALPDDVVQRAAKVAEGWDEKPVYRQRLEGKNSDPEDNVLKEFLIAGTLVERSTADDRGQNEKGRLQIAYPILVGRQHPCGHPDYPQMGNYFHVQGGGGRFPKGPSPSTNKAVVEFLKNKAGMSDDVLKSAERQTVDSIVTGLTKLQGCQLWNHPADLPPLALTKEQASLIGKGYTGPPVDLNGIQLTSVQRAQCAKGFDEQQLRMLKAEVRAQRSAFHEIIDRAVDRAAEVGQGQPSEYVGQAIVSGAAGMTAPRLAAGVEKQVQLASTLVITEH